MKTQPPEALPALIERLRLLPIDHAPDGWPAVRTREITALLDRITELEAQLEAIGAGGVSGPLMGIAAPPTAQAEGLAVAHLDGRMRAVAAEREACAKLVQDMSHQRRWVRAGINGEPIRPCEYAAAIRARGAQGESNAD